MPTPSPGLACMDRRPVLTNVVPTLFRDGRWVKTNWPRPPNALTHPARLDGQFHNLRVVERNA
eukprot:3780279-Lingulodinium_polyedra.AAC.1